MTDTTPTPADLLRAALDRAADLHERFTGSTCGTCADTDGQAAAWPCETASALAVARQLLGTTSCGCPHPTDEHSVYGCAEDCACEWMPPKRPAAPPAPADRAATCICGHPEQQHFEDVCQTCDCGDYIEPQDAREVIARWRQEALSKRDLRRAATLREAADIAEGLRQFDPAYGARKAAQISENVGVLRVADALRRLAADAAAGVQPPTSEAHQPRRGDAVDQWLRAQREAAADYPGAYQATDGLLDLYRLHADMGIPLDGHACEARVIGDCECLEPPAAPAAPEEPA
ncbi:hypothetical protein [Streptomyces californicus]